MASEQTLHLISHQPHTLQKRQGICLGHVQHGAQGSEGSPGLGRAGEAGFTSPCMSFPSSLTCAVLESGLAVLRAPRPCKVYLSHQMVRGASKWHLRWLSPEFVQSVGQHFPLGSTSCTEKEAFSICYHFCPMGSKAKSPGDLCCRDSSARPRAATKGAQFTDSIPLAGNGNPFRVKTSPTAGKMLPGPRERRILTPAQRLNKISQQRHLNSSEREYIPQVYIYYCVSVCWG